MILNYKDSKTWDPIVGTRLSNVLGKSYLKILKENAELIKYRDDDTDAYSLFSKIADRENIRDEVKIGIYRYFKEVTVYHACRTTQVNDYYKKGILPLSSTEAQKQFRDYFSKFVSHQDIDETIKAVSLKTREGIVYATLDDRIFVNTCGHYLIYGGEYLNCLAINLPRASERTRDILKMIGKATVFISRLPFSNVTNLECLASSMIADYFFRYAHNQHEVTTIDYTITLNEAIPPDAIIDHFNPVRIKDPFKNFAVWNDKIKKYE